jgi:hypothetical protein
VRRERERGGERGERESVWERVCASREREGEREEGDQKWQCLNERECVLYRERAL